MNKKYIVSFFLSALIVLLIQLNVSAQPIGGDDMVAVKWFRSRQYLNGLKLLPANCTNINEFYKQYQANKALWDKAFAYLKNTDLEKLPVGKYIVVADSLTVSVTDNPTKPYDQTVWESHRKYIDLQYVIQGGEKMGMVPVSAAKVTEPYNPAKDVAHYESDGTQYLATQGTFFLFFPTDAHRVNIKADGSDHDKKIVLKVLVAQ